MSEPSGSWESSLAAAEARIEELAAGQAEVAARNTRLRRVIADAAERHEAELGAARAERDRANRWVAELELEVAELRRRLSMDSTNSSVPPSKEPIGAREKRRASSERVRSTDRKPGGQPGHPGSGLSREAEPDRSLPADPPAECSSCGEGLTGAEVLPATTRSRTDGGYTDLLCSTPDSDRRIIGAVGAVAERRDDGQQRPEQEQAWPGETSAMDPRPADEMSAYVGRNLLAGWAGATGRDRSQLRLPGLREAVESAGRC